MLRVGWRRNNELAVHFVDMACKSIKLVTRSSFGSETLAGTGAVDDLFPIVVMLQEIVAMEAEKLRSPSCPPMASRRRMSRSRSLQTSNGLGFKGTSGLYFSHSTRPKQGCQASVSAAWCRVIH